MKGDRRSYELLSMIFELNSVVNENDPLSTSGNMMNLDIRNADAPREVKQEPTCIPVKNPDLMGRLHHFQNLGSIFTTPRNVEIWLPPDYDQSHGTRYAVLYMQDGQNLFEPQKSFVGVDWGMDEALTRLSLAKEVQPTLVVGIWNTPQRLREYLPQRPFENPLAPRVKRKVIKNYGGMPLSDHYLSFMVEELKPFIDSRYRTRPEREFTFVMGSSMGGLISLYALLEYPHVFSGAGSLSTHWPFAHKLFRKYLKARLSKPGGQKIYLDYGSEINSIGYRYRQKRVEHILKMNGYRSGIEWLGKWYAGDPHSETAWRRRIEVPLRFLLNNP